MNKLRMPDVFGRMLSQAGAFTYPIISNTDSMNLATLCYFKHGGKTLMVYRDKNPMIFMRAGGMALAESSRRRKTPEE
jgi:hypothetical protein